MDPIFESYLATQVRKRRSPLTVKATVHELRQAQKWLDRQGLDPETLTLLECERYFDELLTRYALSTVRRHLGYLRAAYRHAIRHELTDHDPTAEVRLPRPPDLEPVTYTTDELRAIHDAIRTQRDDLAFHLLAFAGLRLGEAAALTHAQLDLRNQQIRLTGKGGKKRLVPLHPALHQLFADQPGNPSTRPVIPGRAGRPLQPTTLGRDVRALVTRAGHPEIAQPSHAFRRTLATTLYENGIRTRVIEKILGWAPRQMHERHYLRVADTAMHDAILTLYHDHPISDRQHTNQPPKPAPLARDWLAAETAHLRQLEHTINHDRPHERGGPDAGQPKSSQQG